MTVYERQTGAPLTVFPVDAREILAGGSYVAEPPVAAEPDPPATPAAEADPPVDDKPIRGKRR